MNDGNKIPQLSYSVFQISYDEATMHLLGRVVAERADESIFTDGVVDLGKLNSVTFDPALRAYRTLGPVVGKTRSGGDGSQVGGFGQRTRTVLAGPWRQRTIR